MRAVSEPFDILEELRGCRTIGISGHVRPDGDCAGSCLGMALYLENALRCLPQPCPSSDGTPVVDVFLDEFSDSLFRNLAGTEHIRPRSEPRMEVYDAFICMDCECTRLGAALDIFKKAGRRINIDHHETNPGTGDVCYVVPSASSACELVFNTMRREFMDEAVARNLYIGMMTDTGVFAYSSTGRRTMEIAGELMDYGFDHAALVREVFHGKTYLQQQLMGRALLESRLLLDGRCIVSSIDRRTMQFYQAGTKDMEGIAAQLMRTEGAECAVFMYEIRPGSYKLSLRSNGRVDVAVIGAACGGGGHVRASGCTIDASPREIVRSLLPLIREQLEQKTG